MGPLLFLVYINDITEDIKLTVRLFVHASLLHRIIKSKEDQIILQEDLPRLQKWERKWQMQFNADKFEVLQNTKKKKILPSATTASMISICRLSNRPSTSALQSAQIFPGTNTVKKATNSLHFLRWNIQDCPPLVKEQCYKTLVPPTMEYTSSVWDPYTNTNIKKLEMVQRRAVCFVKGDYGRTSSLTALLDELGLDTIQERRQQAKATLFYRIVYGLVCAPS